MNNDSQNSAMKSVSPPRGPGDRYLTGPACRVVAMCGALMLAPQSPQKGVSREEAIAALAEVGGVLRYDDLKRPVWLGFVKGRRDVDDAALAYVEKLETLEEITFFPVDLLRRGLSEHPLVTDKGLAHLPLPRLRALGLLHTGVRGPGLAQLHGNKKLAELSIAGEPLGDEGLKYLAGFDSLSSLVLAGDSITGKGLAHVADLANLRSLWLGCRRISPEGVAHLSRMTYLAGLFLYIRELDHIEFLRNFTRLTRLSLGGMPIADADLVHIAGLNGLTSLDLDGTRIGDGGLHHLAGLTNLAYLDLSDTRITDAGLARLPPLSKCTRLTIHRTAITPEGVARLKAKYPSMRVLR